MVVLKTMLGLATAVAKIVPSLTAKRIQTDPAFRSETSVRSLGQERFELGFLRAWSDLRPNH
jgi:hypothetical protein